MVETAGSASVEIEASPAAVYAILTDLSRISELSPECYRAEWEGDATGPEAGATFRGYNRNRDHEWDAGCVVLAATPGEEWAFEVPAGDGRSTVWRYQIAATDSGCEVTESFDSPILDGEFFQKMNRHDLLVKNIARTLDNLKAVAEAEG
ncbi:MAG: SRPBCC family protein [Actinomycetota bacterium]